MYILLIYRDPAAWRSLTAGERAAVAREHDAFQRSVTELVFAEAFADPARAATVRVRDGRARAVAGLYLDGPAFLSGYYLVDCDRRERALELAARVPDARHAAVEVRELTYQFGTEYAAGAGHRRNVVDPSDLVC